MHVRSGTLGPVDVVYSWNCCPDDVATRLPPGALHVAIWSGVRALCRAAPAAPSQVFPAEAPTAPSTLDLSATRVAALFGWVGRDSEVSAALAPSSLARLVWLPLPRVRAQRARVLSEAASVRRPPDGSAPRRRRRRVRRRSRHRRRACGPAWTAALVALQRWLVQGGSVPAFRQLWFWRMHRKDGGAVVAPECL